jgi:hypothetical protein
MEPTLQLAMRTVSQMWVETHGPRGACGLLFYQVLCAYGPFEAEASLDNTEAFSPYLKENATLYQYKDELVFKKLIAVY